MRKGGRLRAASFLLLNLRPRPALLMPGGKAVRRALPAMMLALVCSAARAAEEGPLPLPLPLPKDPFAAAWTREVESVFYDYLELMGPVRPVLPGEKLDRKARVRRIFAAYRRIAKSNLPENDLLRREAARMPADRLRRLDPAAAAEFAVEADDLRTAAHLYQSYPRLGKERAVPRLERELERREREYLKRRAEPGKGAGGYEAVLDNRRRVTGWKKGPATSEQWITMVTTDRRNPWSRQYLGGFTEFAKPFPNNARLRRALALYYTPSLVCGNSHVTGDMEISEHILRLTAEGLPGELGRTYAAVARAGLGQFAGMSDLPSRGGPWRIPGDYGTTANGLLLARDLISRAPGAREQILATARELGLAHRYSQRRCRWRALAAYIEDGMPDPGEEWKAAILPKFSGSERERRWALAWAASKVAESWEMPRPRVLEVELAAAAAQAASKCRTPEDVILALEVLAYCMPPDGLDSIMAAAGSKDRNVRKFAVFALEQQYQRAGKPDPIGRPTVVRPQVLVDRLEELRRAFHPHLDSHPGKYLLPRLFADLGDTRLDAALAAKLLGMRYFDQSFVQEASNAAARRPGLGWKKTLAALDALSGKGRHGQTAAAAAERVREAIEKAGR